MHSNEFYFSECNEINFRACGERGFGDLNISLVVVSNRDTAILRCKILSLTYKGSLFPPSKSLEQKEQAAEIASH